MNARLPLLTGLGCFVGNLHRLGVHHRQPGVHRCHVRGVVAEGGNRASVCAVEIAFHTDFVFCHFIPMLLQQINDDEDDDQDQDEQLEK